MLAVNPIAKGTYNHDFLIHYPRPTSCGMILSSTESYHALKGRVNEIQALGEEYLMHSYFLHCSWRRLVVGHIAILFGMSFQRQSQYMYCMNSPNSMQCSPK